MLGCSSTRQFDHSCVPEANEHRGGMCSWGDACSQGIFYPLHRQRRVGIGSGEEGERSCMRINQFGIRRWHWQPAM